MDISEIFYSIQGEGIFVGAPTVFVRTSGCNLRCSYCDTKYAYEEPGKKMSLDEIVEVVRKFKSKYVCITGGEPLLQQDKTLDLIGRLLNFNYENISIETNGSIDISPILNHFGDHNNKDRVTISMDIKCPSSNMSNHMKMDNIHLLRETDQLKFVIQDEEDYKYSKEIIHRYNPRSTVLLQPVWGTNLTLLADWILKDNLNARLSLQIHKIIWGERRGV